MIQVRHLLRLLNERSDPEATALAAAVKAKEAAKAAEAGRVEELGRLIEENGKKKEEEMARHAEELRRLAEELEKLEAEKATLDLKRAADKAAEDRKEVAGAAEVEVGSDGSTNAAKAGGKEGKEKVDGGETGRGMSWQFTWQPSMAYCDRHGGADQDCVHRIHEGVAIFSRYPIVSSE